MDKYYEEYNHYLEEGDDITLEFDLNYINIDNIIMEKVLTGDRKKTKDGLTNLYLSYVFVYDNSYCLIVLLDKTPRGVQSDFLWRENVGYGFYSGEYDRILNYIHNIKRFKVIKFTASWFQKYNKSGCACELERDVMFPFIRKYKIEKLLK